MLSSKAAAPLVLHDCPEDKQCVMYLDSADQDLDVPDLVILKASNNR